MGNNALISGTLSISGNSSTTVTTNRAQINIGGSDQRDSYLSFISKNATTSVDTWSVGLDQTNDYFKISSSTTLGTNDYFTIATVLFYTDL